MGVGMPGIETIPSLFSHTPEFILMVKKIRTVAPVIAIIIVMRAVIITMIVKVIPVPNKIVTIDPPPIAKMLSRVES